MKNKLIPFIVAVFSVSPFAMANDSPSYDYVEAGYIQSSFNGGSTDGYKIAGSVTIGEYFLLLADYSNTSGSFDINDSNIFDVSRLNYGLGGKYDFANGGSIYGIYTVGSWDFLSFNADIKTSTKIGYRHMVSEQLELNGGVSWNNFSGLIGGDDFSESGVNFGLAYNFATDFAITADFESIGDFDEYSVGIRWNF